MSQMSWEESVQWLRNQPDQQALVAACYFDDPLIEAAERYYKSGEWSAISRLFPNTRGYALDLGAGRGISSYALARDGWTVTALEPDPSALVGAGAIRSLASHSGLSVEIVSDYSEKLPFPDNHFDIVNCRQVLHHTRNLKQTCCEIFRVLKPHGVMVASREHVISKAEDLDIFLRGHDLHKYYGGENAFLLEDYIFALREAGLEVKNVLAPWDSPINYFPMTETQLFESLVRPYVKLFGHGISSLIFSPDNMIGRLLLKLLISFRNSKDESPGRLYSFVASKPAE